MLRADAWGRVPFALVAVLLLLSGGVSALYAAKLAQDETSRRMREAQLEALAGVADLVHREVEAHAQHLAIQAIARGTSGIVNESRVREVFRAEFADYVSSHFPRTLRSIAVAVDDHVAFLRLVDRRMTDAVPSNATTTERLGGVRLSVPDPKVGYAWEEVDRLAYFALGGYVNYTLALNATTLRRQAALETIVPVPAVLMEAKLEQASRTGFGDLAGIGRTVKAILTAIVQFRILRGFASPVAEDTTTYDVLTTKDVELAVNFAVLLEEARLFRTFDTEAATALDAARGALPPIPPGLPPFHERTFARLLARYAANGAVDAVDLFALFAGLDALGLSVGAVLGQAIAAVADDLVLRPLDYLGLTPLADWFVEMGGATADAFEDFLRWLAGRPSRQVEYVHQYLRALFVDTGIGTRFFGPAQVEIPDRTYDIPNGSGRIRIAIPAYVARVAFQDKDLLAAEHYGFWEAHVPRLLAGVERIRASARDLVNTFAARIGESAVLAGLLPASATGVVDPSDRSSFLEVLADRVRAAVDDAIAALRANSDALDGLMVGFRETVVTTAKELVGALVADYAAIVQADAAIPEAESSLAVELYGRSSSDPDFPSLNASQLYALKDAIRADVEANGWATAAYEERRRADLHRWERAVSAFAGTPALGDPDRWAGVREAVAGAAGWLPVARDAVSRMLDEIVRGQDVAGLHTPYPIRLEPFRLWDARRPDRARIEAFRVRHAPPDLTARALDIVITDPADVVAGLDSPNVHHTRPFATSHRPFTTGWGVTVTGSVRLRVETATAMLLGPQGLEPAAVEGEWPLAFAFVVSASSGWNLTGVSYANSATLGGDVGNVLLRVLETVWDGLLTIAKALLAVLRPLFAILMEILEPILAFAHRVVETLTDLVAKAVDLLHEVVVRAANSVAGPVDVLADSLPPSTRFTYPGYGLTFHFAANEPGGRELTLAAEWPFARADLSFRDLQEAGLVRSDGLRYDVLAAWALEAGPLRLDASFDPLVVVQSTAIAGNASLAGSWAMDFAGPLASPFFSAKASAEFGPIPVPPIGTAEIEVGVRVDMTRDVVGRIYDLLDRTIDEVLGATTAEPLDWEGVGRFAANVVDRLRARIAEFAATHASDVLEVVAYAHVQIHGAGGPGGLGFQLAFVADGQAVRDVLAWVARNLEAFYRNRLNPLSPADYEDLPSTLPQHLFLRAEGYFVFELPAFLDELVEAWNLRMKLAARIEANAATLGMLLGQDWGPWQITFGAYASVPAPLLGPLGGPLTIGGHLWVLRGGLHAY